MKLFVATTTLLSVLLGMHGSAAAADAAGATDSLPVPPMLLKNDSPNAEHWTFSVSPYIWAAGIHGNVGQFGMAATHISSDFGTILKNVDLSFMAGGEARYGRYGLLADVMYGRVSTGGKFDVTSKTFTSFLGEATTFSTQAGVVWIWSRALVSGMRAPKSISPVDYSTVSAEAIAQLGWTPLRGCGGTTS